jgi:23S rRNA (adenine2030-N6)-methyltransferase
MEAPFPPMIEALLVPWRVALAAVRRRHGPLAYPGSPLLGHEMLREEDRAILVEKHPEDHATLARHFRRAANVKAVRLDGWTALGSFVPPKERRGLVLIDPPFEEPGEFARCSEKLVRAVRRWPTGIFALWYPVKREDETRSLAQRLAAECPAPTLRLELSLAPADGSRLVGSGLAVVNPPWTLAQEAGQLLPALGERFGRSPSHLCEELVAEDAQRHPRPASGGA